METRSVFVCTRNGTFLYVRQVEFSSGNPFLVWWKQQKVLMITIRTLHFPAQHNVLVDFCDCKHLKASHSFKKMRQKNSVIHSYANLNWQTIIVEKLNKHKSVLCISEKSGGWVNMAGCTINKVNFSLWFTGLLDFLDIYSTFLIDGRSSVLQLHTVCPTGRTTPL